MGTYASLPARIGLARARQMVLMGQPISADDAYAWGLVDALADPGGALTAAMADARTIAAKPAQALGVVKQMLTDAPRLHPLDVLDREAAEQSRLFDSDDFAEGIAAFHAKRPPVFSQSTATQGVSS
jgi:2-(1,2-epoxy-1,2-dihydrophenyl)acetyl-CoA isomerase